MQEKIKNIPTKYPNGLVLQSSFLAKEGYSYVLQQHYRKSGLLKLTGKGAMLKSDNDSLIFGALASLQQQSNHSVHIGGRTALALLGQAHHLQINMQSVSLFKEPTDYLPKWFLSGQWDLGFEVFNISLFEDKSAGYKDYESNGLALKISNPARALKVDLTFILFTENREDAFPHIRQGLMNIKEGIQVNLSGVTFPDTKRADEELKLFGLKDNAVIKIEVNQINRGLIANARVLTLSKKAQDYFDTYCKATIVSQGQLWGGKINAALDRQPPKDLFDMRNFYQNHTLTDEIKRGFLYYLLCSKRPIHEVLQPKNIDRRGVLLNQFIGMSDTPFSYEDYEKARQENIDTVNKSLTDSDKDFLLSFLKGEPKWTENYNFSQYPPIRWKLLNLERLKTLNPEKFNSQVELLEKAVEKGGR